MDSIKNTRDFSYVYRKGKSKADRNLVLYAARREGKPHSLGISVSKKVGNSVVRHKIKRKVKEIARLNHASFPNEYAYVVIARKPAAEADYHELEYSTLRLLKQLSLENI